MRRLRQLAFVLTGTVFRIPIYGILWMLGKLHFIKLIFQVYPTDETETREFCPNIPIFRQFFSARPTLGGFIVKGIRPIGIYVGTPNTAQELIKRKNAELSHTIIRQLHWLSQLTGAQAIGLAGQLGFIFERRHHIQIEKPFYGSLYGAIFSLSETISLAIRAHKLPLDQVTIGILGMGDIGNMLCTYLGEKGFRIVPIDLRYGKNGTLSLRDEEKSIPLLKTLHLLVNMTPTGENFLQTQCHQHLAPSCIIIDFARPGISPALPNIIYMGNRVHQRGIRFILSLPGDWNHHDIPACSLAALLSTQTNPIWTDVEEFCKIAKEQKFFVSLEGPNGYS